MKLNNGPEQKIKKGEDLTIPRLKYGDTVVIESDAEWKELETRRDLILQSEEQLQSGEAAYKYTMIVPQKGGEFVFNPAEYQYAHGTLSFFCFGEEVNSIQYLAKGSKITYAQKTADDGYWLSEGEHVITVTTPEATRKELQSIAFTEKVRVNVQLNQPAFGGRIEYYANGVRIDTSEYKSDSGAVISMKFFPWEGWIKIGRAHV